MPRGVKVQVLPGAPSQEKGRSSFLLRPFLCPRFLPCGRLSLLSECCGDCGNCLDGLLCPDNLSHQHRCVFIAQTQQIAVGAPLEARNCVGCGSHLDDSMPADMSPHHDMCVSSPDGPKGGTGSPSDVPAIPRYGKGAPAGKTCFANPRFRPLTPTPFGLLRRHTPVLAL